jgi:flagellin-like hook-associated protein FlgL
MSIFLNAQSQNIRNQQIKERQSVKHKGLFDKLQASSLSGSADVNESQSINQTAKLKDQPISLFEGSQRFKNKKDELSQPFAKDIQQSIVLMQSATFAVDQSVALLSEMKSLIEQAMNQQLTAHDRKNLQLELNKLNQSLFRIALKTTYQGKSLFKNDHTKVKLVTQSNGKIEEVDIHSIRPDILAKQARLHSAHGVASELSLLGQYSTQMPEELKGKLWINGIEIRDSLATDDRYSTKDPMGSAIAKANVINAYRSQTGVEAFVSMTRTDLNALRNDAFGIPLFGPSTPIQAIEMEKNEQILLNGIKIQGLKIQDKDENGSLRTAINAIQNQTGVVAELSEQGELVLSAIDGRNIHLKYEDEVYQGRRLEEYIGLRDGNGGLLCYTAQLILFSKKMIDLRITGPMINDSLGDLLGVSIGEQILTQGEFSFALNRNYALSQINVRQGDEASWAMTTLSIASEEIQQIQKQLSGIYQKLTDLGGEQSQSYYNHHQRFIHQKFDHVLMNAQAEYQQKRLEYPALDIKAPEIKPLSKLDAQTSYSQALIEMVNDIQGFIATKSTLALIAQANFTEASAWSLLEADVNVPPQLQIQQQLYPSLFYMAEGT